KTDLASPAELAALEGILLKLNPTAKCIPTQHGQVKLSDIINTGLFDMETAQSSAGWLKELEGEHTPETEEYGISSFVFKARRPFHPERLLNFLTGDHMPKVLRSKGFFWLASRHDNPINWSLAGKVAR